MKPLVLSLIVALAVMMSLPGGAVFAQKSLPQVPITYPGDTEVTIAKRAQWIEGAKKEGRLVYWGTTNPNLATKVIAEFNKVYPYIKVEYWRAKGEEISPKLEMEFSRGKSAADIVLGGEPYNYPRWREMGMLQKFIDIVPGIEKRDKRQYSKYGDSMMPGGNDVAPQYNTKLVKATEAPKNWEDLLDPKWKGQLAMTTDMKVWTTLALEDGGWGIERTENFLKRLKLQELKWAPGHTAGHSLLIAGDFKILVEDYTYHVPNSQEKGAPVEWIRVDPVPVTGSSFTMQKKAPHPNAARLYLEWLFSPGGLMLWDKLVGFGPVFPGSGTRASKRLAGMNLCIRTEDGILKAINLGLAEKFAQILGIKPGGD